MPCSNKPRTCECRDLKEISGELVGWKCQVLTISRKLKPMRYDYILHGFVLEHVTMAKYLGMTIQHDMKWNTHINKITTSANRSLGFLRRNLQVNSHELKTIAYNALVRPLLEYAPSVWDPHTKKGIFQVEKVQRHGESYVLNRHRNRSSPKEMFIELRWTSLEERRRYQHLIMLFKIRNMLVAIDANEYMTPINRPTRHHNTQVYLVPQSNLNIHQYSFFPALFATGTVYNMEA